MKRFILLVLLSVAAVGVQAQDFDGSWGGEISLGGGRTLSIIFNIAGSEATADSPTQGAMGIPMTSVEYVSGSVALECEPLDMGFTGSKINGSCIAGIFRQRGFSMPLMLTRREPAVLSRPQEPQPPYPYRVEEVEFPSAAEGITMHGTLTVPDDGGPHPAVVLVTGSGTQNRDEEILGHKPFKVIADRLSRRGIAVLRYDDREFTTQSYDGATTLDYAADALQAVEFLRSRPEADASNIGVIGHSEGGTIAFICAAGDPRIAFIVSLAGMTVAGVDCIMDQNRWSLNEMVKSGSIDEAMAGDVCEVLNSVFGEIRGMSADDIKAGADAIIERAAAKASNRQSVALVREQISETLGRMNEWLAFFIGYDPSDAISKVRCPVLALNGEKDMQVVADTNLGRLAAFRNLDGRLTVRRFDGLNHLFQHCQTGSPAEYGQIEETFADEVLTIVADWITGLSAR